MVETSRTSSSRSNDDDHTDASPMRPQSIITFNNGKAFS